MDRIDLTRRLIAIETLDPEGTQAPRARLPGGTLGEGGFEIGHHELAGEGASAVAEIDVRATPGIDHDEVWADLARLLDGPLAVGALPFSTGAAVPEPALGDAPIVIPGPGDTHTGHRTDELCYVPPPPAPPASPP